MDGERQLERLYERVRLVRSLGSRSRGELCIMSFVALLAGERHTDQPLSASPLIRELVIPINDTMPEAARQRLKPFAPRILGTNDGCDEARVELLRQVLSERLLPRVHPDRATKPAAGRRPLTGCLSRSFFQRDLEADIGQLLTRIERGIPRHRQALLGSGVGELLAWCMRTAVTPEQRARYRNETLMLLDDLCNVGVSARCFTIPDRQIGMAVERLDSIWSGSIRRPLPMFGMASDRLLNGRTLRHQVRSEPVCESG